MIDLANKRILISGIHGFLGANAAALAINAGAKVLGIGLHATSEFRQQVCSSLCGHNIDYFQGDLSKSALWSQAINDFRPDMILHSAGTTSRGYDPESLQKSVSGNYLTTAAMIEAVISMPQDSRPAILYPGSQMEYGKADMPWTEVTLCKPYNPYGATKLAATELLSSASRAGMLKACTGRIPIMYGPGQSPAMFIPELIITAIAGKSFKMTEGIQKRKFIFAADAAEVLFQIGLDLLNGKRVPAVINLPASNPKSIKDIAKTLAAEFSENFSLEVGAIPSRTHEILESWPDDTRAAELGYNNATTLADGLAKTVKWYKDNPWFYQD